MKLVSVALLGTTIVLGGCSVSTKLTLPAHLRAELDAHEGGIASGAVQPQRAALLRYVAGETPTASDDVRIESLPSRLKNTAVITKIEKLSKPHFQEIADDVSLAVGSVNLPGNEHKELTLTAAEVREFASLAMELAFDELDGQGSSESLAAGNQESTFGKRVRAYLRAYVNGSFVDRAGVKYSKPKLSKDGVDNDTITGLITVVLEAVFDAQFQTPVYAKSATADVFKEVTKPVPASWGLPGKDLYIKVFEKSSQTTESYFTADNAKPTALAFDASIKAAVADDKAPGVDAKELKATMTVTKLSGEQSKAISGLLIRSFGGLTAEFVIGGEFSVGDNESLAKVVEAVVATTARRVTMASALAFFEDYPMQPDIAGGPTLSNPGIDQLIDAYGSDLE